MLEASTKGTLSYLEDKLSGLDADSRAVIDKAAEALRTVFATGT